MFMKLLVFLILYLCFSRSQTTFKNVTFSGYARIYDIDVLQCKIVIISSNRLSDYLPKVQKIVIINQDIPILYENALANLNGLKYLIIENSNVSEMRPGILKNVSTLRELSIKENALEEIKEGVFNNLPIQLLDLSKNTITTIETGAFDDMFNLRFINLNYNKISVWNNDWFKNTPKITTLSMEKNYLNELQEHAFNHFGKCSNCDSLFLHFGSNEINKVHPKALKGLHKIDYLWLDNNKLKAIDANFLEDITEINYLYLFNNSIVNIEGDFSKIFKARTTDLRNNPLDCDRLKKILKWSETSKKTVVLSNITWTCRLENFRKLKDEVKTLQKLIDYYDDLLEGEDVSIYERRYQQTSSNLSFYL